jgi:integrase/recombinase XerD
LIDSNIILAFRRRFLRVYKNEEVVRKIPDIDVMSRFVNSISKPRDRAIVLLFCKTGVRRNELVTLDLDDIDWTKQSIILKRTAKRSNRLIYFDFEMAKLLQRWIRLRENLCPHTQALFIGPDGARLGRHGVYDAVVRWAVRFGLHDPSGKAVEDSFSPHSIRHWWTTMLLRGGMKREHVQVLRGDAPSAAIDLYTHVDPEELRLAYLAAIPQLGVL